MPGRQSSPSFSTEFSFNVVTMTLGEANGVVTNLINVEGTADGFGAVVGTITAASRAGDSSGTYSVVLANFPQTGDGVTSTGDGEWSKIAWDPLLDGRVQHALQRRVDETRRLVRLLREDLVRTFA